MYFDRCLSLKKKKFHSVMFCFVLKLVFVLIAGQLFNPQQVIWPLNFSIMFIALVLCTSALSLSIFLSYSFSSWTSFIIIIIFFFCFTTSVMPYQVKLSPHNVLYKRCGCLFGRDASKC